MPPGTPGYGIDPESLPNNTAKSGQFSFCDAQLLSKCLSFLWGRLRVTCSVQTWNSFIGTSDPFSDSASAYRFGWVWLLWRGGSKLGCQEMEDFSFKTVTQIKCDFKKDALCPAWGSHHQLSFQNGVTAPGFPSGAAAYSSHPTCLSPSD